MRTDRALPVFPYWGATIFWKMGDPQDTPFPIVDRMTDACENITFPNTTYAVGNKLQSSFIDNNVVILMWENQQIISSCCNFLLSLNSYTSIWISAAYVFTFSSWSQNTVVSQTKDGYMYDDIESWENWI